MDDLEDMNPIESGIVPLGQLFPSEIESNGALVTGSQIRRLHIAWRGSKHHRQPEMKISNWCCKRTISADRCKHTHVLRRQQIQDSFLQHVTFQLPT